MAPSKLHSPELRANLTAGCQRIGACHTPGPKYSCALAPLASLLHESHGSGSGGTHRTVACWRADHRRRGHLTQRVWARALEPSGSKALLNELPVRSNAASTVDTIELESLEPPGSTGPLREAWARKRTLRKCLLEAGLTAGPVEQLLASTRHVGDHAEARLDFWCREGPAAGGAEGAAAAALVGNPWLLTCDYHEMLAIRSCLLHHGVSLRHNTKILVSAEEYTGVESTDWRGALPCRLTVLGPRRPLSSLKLACSSVCLQGPRLQAASSRCSLCWPACAEVCPDPRVRQCGGDPGAPGPPGAARQHPPAACLPPPPRSQVRPVPMTGAGGLTGGSQLCCWLLLKVLLSTSEGGPAYRSPRPLCCHSQS
jgi:hypothetical protein